MSKPKFRHIAIVCEDPRALGKWYQEAFDLQFIGEYGKNGVTLLSDGEFNLTLLAKSFLNHDAVNWHFGIEMTMEEIEERRPLLESLGATYSDGVRDGRSVEVYVKDPEGHRIDLAPYWPTKPGAEERQDSYQTWDGKEHAPVAPHEVVVSSVAK
ncbi:MAG TPA: VOC family protein [Chloroflexota bacterium]|jgi:catechol 2,3-dioxygenase-like lactoylglutathione lyase family enzyme